MQQDHATATLHRIVYISRARQSLYEVELEALATRSAARNEAHDITGLLLYDGSRFMQALEGPRDAVEKTMARIERDPAHDSIEYMVRQPAEERRFGNWALAHRRVGAGCCTPEFVKNIKDQVAQVPDPYLQAAFIGFARLGSKASNPEYPCEHEH